MINNTIELLEEDNQTIKIKDLVISITHNDIGFNVDIWKNEELIEEQLFYFEDFEN